FRFEFSFQRFEFCLEQTDSARLKNLDVELILSARFKNGHSAVKLHLGSVDKRLSRQRDCVAPNHARDLGALILESEILMTARTQFVIRNLALHPDRTESCFERAADLSG